MWDTAKQRLYDDLRGRGEKTALTTEEEQQLKDLAHELEQAEWAALRPGLEAYRAEQQQLRSDLDRVRAENVALEVLAKRYADLLARARAQLDALTRERDELRAEYERVLG